MNSLVKTLLVWAALAPVVMADMPRSIEIRMLNPLRTTHPSADGSRIRAVLIKPFTEDGEILMPAGTIVHGNVRHSRRVGFGIRHERASIELDFDECQLPDGERVAIEARLSRIDNAREQVDRNGKIRGILAASNPLGIARGMWYWPDPRFLFMAPGGLTGGAGTAWAKLALGPIGAAGLFGARLLLTTFPDPEIDLPAGAEITLLVHPFTSLKSWGSVPPAPELASSLAQFLSGKPVQIAKADGTVVADLINLAFVGPKSILVESFVTGGWVEAEPLTRKSFAKSYSAFTQRQGYPTAPVSKLFYETRLPDLVFEKSLNSIAKRHHIRLWNAGTFEGEDIWLGAATHDVTVTFNRSTFGLSHRVAANLDREREKVITDLGFVNASASTAYLPRAIVPLAGVQSDGSLAVLRLQTPSAQDQWDVQDLVRPSNMHRLSRRMVLETRQYLFRENPYYLGYRAVRGLAAKKRLAGRDATTFGRDNSVCFGLNTSC